MTILTNGRNFLLCLGGFYVILLLSLLQPSLQRELFYLNSLKFPWLVDTGRPERSGFSIDRVDSFFLPGSLHAWHIRPFAKQTKPAAESNSSQRESQIIIYLHGTAGTLAVPHRLTTYRILSALPGVHVLALDYRGYGLSAGTPDEQGLIDDGVSAVRWAMQQGFKAQQITLFGQSLGSAVALAVAHRLAIEVSDEDRVEVGHVVSIAGFSSATEIVKTYRLAGIVPILSPFRTYPFLQRWLVGKLQHKWDSISRARALGAQTRIRLTFAHAMTDTEIPCINSEQLFVAALLGDTECAVLEDCLKSNGIAQSIKDGFSSKSLSDGGHIHEITGDRQISYLELYWGAHNLVQWNDELLSRI